MNDTNTGQGEAGYQQRGTDDPAVQDPASNVNFAAQTAQQELRDENDGETPKKFLKLPDVAAITIAARSALAGRLGEPIGGLGYDALTATGKAVANDDVAVELGLSKGADKETPDAVTEKAKADLFSAIVKALKPYTDTDDIDA